MTLKRDDKFEEKLTLDSKNDVRNLVNFNACNGKPENLHFDVLLLSIAYEVAAKKSREMLCLMTVKSDAKFEEKLNLGSKNDMRNLLSFAANSGKSENLQFDMLLLSIACKVSAKKEQKDHLS